MGESDLFTILHRKPIHTNMNRFLIVWVSMAFAAAVAENSYHEKTNLFDPPRDVQTDFLETMMHDGEYPEHFFDTPVAAKGTTKKDVAPLYDQESELYASLIQEEADAKGIRIKNRLKSAKAVYRKSKAFKKVLSAAKGAIGKAIKFSKKLLGREVKGKSPPSPHQMVKNAMYLKAFATINADKLYAVAKHMGALGALLQDMSVKTKKVPVAQYADAMKRLTGLHSHGIWKYTLEHVADAMYGKGLVSLGPIASKDGNFIRIDPRDIGLIRGFPILDTTATYVGVFQKEISRIAKGVLVDMKQKYMAAPFSKKDFKRLFRSTCSGTGKDVKDRYNKCFPQQTKKTCDANSHFGCKWVGEWKGNYAEEPME